MQLTIQHAAFTLHSKQTAESRIKELEGCVKELQRILERAEKESDERYAALQQKYTDLQVLCLYSQLLLTNYYMCMCDWMLSCKPFTLYQLLC